MNATDLNVYQVPVPPVPVPEGYRMDGKGRMVHVAAIKPQELIEDEMVRKVMGFACDLANQLRRFRNNCFADSENFQALLAQEYGVTKRGARGKGNLTFMTVDGLMRMQIQVADHLTFGPELQTARAIFSECIEDWSEGARVELRTLVDEAFEGDKEGNINRDAIFRLLRLSFEDPRWKAGQSAIRDSIRVVGSKAYCRFYIRPAQDAAWMAVPIDLAAA